MIFTMFVRILNYIVLGNLKSNTFEYLKGKRMEVIG